MAAVNEERSTIQTIANRPAVATAVERVDIGRRHESPSRDSANEASARPLEGRISLHRGKNLESKVVPAFRGKCDRPDGAYPLHGLPNRAAFALHEVASHEQPGSVLARGTMNEYRNAPPDVPFDKRKRCRKNAKTVLEIAIAWRRISRQRNARVSQSSCREIFRTAELAVVDRQHGAKTRLAQVLEAPGLLVGTAASGEQIGYDPKYVVHVNRNRGILAGKLSRIVACRQFDHRCGRGSAHARVALAARCVS